MIPDRSRRQRLQNDEMMREYDFPQCVRGKYTRRYARGSNVVTLEPDVAKAFPNAEAVNCFATESGGEHSSTQIARIKIENRRLI